MSGIARMLAAEHDAALGGPRDERPLAEALVRAARLAPPGADVLFATGPEGIGPEDEPPLARLARRRRVTVLVPLDPLDVNPPDRPLPIRSGALMRYARLQPLDRAALGARLGRLNVTLMVLEPT